MKNQKSKIKNQNLNQKVKIFEFWFVILIFAFCILNLGPVALAAEPIAISPPLVTLVPRDLGNNEIWYVGGTASVPNTDIVIYLQSTRGDTLSFITKSNERGEWLYTHTDFLREGKYKSWAQMRVKGELSPPSPEVAFEIIPTALRIGSYRLSYEILYAILALLLLSAVLVLSAFGIYHFRHYHKKSSRLRQEIREAEDEVRRGFDTLRKDILEEMEFIGGIKLSRELSMEEHRREEKLLQDLKFIEGHILKEIGDIEPAIP